MGARVLAPDISNSQKAEESSPCLPPGFRFHPTDEELVNYYLVNKVVNGSFPVQAIAEVDLNKCEPWDLPAKAKMGEKEWYFYSLRDRKYPTGMRTNRATEAGYWKATGKDREVMSSRTGRLVGMKKTLVFYRGRAPKGEKTNWIMHEYRIEGDPNPLINNSKLSKGDEWVVCRIFQKSAGGNPKKQPMDSCGNGSGGGNFIHRAFNPDARSSLPPLLESPNPNNSVDDSDCLIDNSNLPGGLQADSIMRPNSSWGFTKGEIGATLDALDYGKSSLLSFVGGNTLFDVHPTFTNKGAPSSGLKVNNTAYTNLLRQHDRNNSTVFEGLEPSQLVPLRYLSQLSDSRGMANLRACKAEPHGGDDDEAQSAVRHRPSLIDSWVGGDSANSFGGEASGLPPVTNDSAIRDLDNTSNNPSFYQTAARFRSLDSSSAFIPDPLTSSNPHSGVELSECLWNDY